MWRKLFFTKIPENFQKIVCKNCTRFRPHPQQFYSSSSTSNLEVTPLKSRSLVRLRGSEIRDLLQGLLTNDVAHLEQKSSCYTLLLNHQGRVLFDALLYNPTQEQESSVVGTDDDTLLIECDSSFRTKLISHLKLYKLKRKVEIEPEDKLSVWVVYDAGNLSGSSSSTSKRENLPLKLDSKIIHHFGDPRLPELGWRIFGPSDWTPTISNNTGKIVQEDEERYKDLRYTLGVGEGVVEIPFGKSFPLEVNGDFLHGISFHKGCYLGQELTARTHHTGVVRKRLMPFRLTDTSAGDKIHGDATTFQIFNEKNRPIGNVRGLNGSLGIAVFRVEETLSASSLILNQTEITVSKPSWWPIEAAKEVSSKKS